MGAVIQLNNLNNLKVLAGTDKINNVPEIPFNELSISFLTELSNFLKEITLIKEVSIGHALISESLYMGLENVINLYINKLNK